MSLDSPSNAQPARLLLVDDEAPHLEALRQVLGDEGYEVSGAADPHAALALLRASPHDVMLCDLKMPGMDGIELVRRARELDPDLVAVMMTGHGSIETAVEAMKAGVMDYVLKPLRMSTLRPALGRALELRRLRLHNRALQERVAAYTARLEAANRELDAFAGRVAHDLQGPVHVMLAFARILQEKASHGLDATARRHLERIVASGERTEHLIRDLLRFARLGDGAMQRAPVALADVVSRARLAVQEQAGDRQVAWEIGAMPQVQGDASLLEQVFVNLLSNALKFTRPCEQARVEVGSRQTDGTVEIWVRDNGVGFEPTQAHRLFGAFERLHRADQFEGSGLGLASCKRIVERHGGTMRAESSPGVGTTLTLSLPLGT